MQPISPGTTGTAERRDPAHTRSSRPAAGPRLVPDLTTQIQPLSWWERRCPSCDRSFTRDVAVCPSDATPLQRVEVSLPFIWIG